MDTGYGTLPLFIRIASRFAILNSSSCNPCQSECESRSKKMTNTASEKIWVGLGRGRLNRARTLLMIGLGLLDAVDERWVDGSVWDCRNMLSPQ
jgi:hypothetical protein